METAAQGGTGAAPDPVLMDASAMVFVDDPSAPVLSPADTHHLLAVLRLRPGEPVVAADGSGAWAPCRMAPRVTGHGGSDPASVLEVDGPLVRRPRPAPEITVAFAPAKGDRPEWVTQKLTELGVDRIVPVLTGRSVVRWEGERGSKAVERLRRVAAAAAAQARTPWLPEVSGVTPLAVLATLVGDGLRLAHPGGGPPSLAHPVLVVGPEGGWEDGEFQAAGGTVGLGPTVLRAETAAVVAGALLCALRGGVVASLAQPRSVSKTT